MKLTDNWLLMTDNCKNGTVLLFRVTINSNFALSKSPIFSLSKSNFSI